LFSFIPYRPIVLLYHPVHSDHRFIIIEVDGLLLKQGLVDHCLSFPLSRVARVSLLYSVVTPTEKSKNKFFEPDTLD
jgi:hypothetical protein